MAANDEISYEAEFPERKKLCTVVVDTFIHDIELPAKIKEKLQELNLSIDPEKIYSVDVSFDMGAYSDPTFYKFSVERPQWAEEKFEKLDKEEKRKQTIYDVLSAQLDKICKELSSLNLKYKNAYIIGENFEKVKHVELEIKERSSAKPKENEASNSKKTKKGEKILVSHSIIPDRPYTLNSAAEMFAELFLRQQREENIKKIEKSRHTPNMISAEKIFKTLADAIIDEFPDKYSSPEMLVGELLKQARLKNDWPLEIAYDGGVEANDNSIEKDSEIDCPEYLIYIKRRHCWVLKKVNDLDSAKRTILYDGYNKKYVDEVIVLHNLEHIRFNLFTEDNGEIKPISKSEAHTAKKLLLSWCSK